MSHNSLNIRRFTDPFTGTLFTPSAIKQRVGVVVVPGSDGGIPESIAERISMQGFPALALGYFGCEGRPQHLENIDLEYFQKATQSFKAGFEKVVLLGYSRGGELVLILSSLFPDLADGIIAFAPSSYATGGFPHPNRPAWILNGQPLPAFIKGLMSDREDLLESEDLALACKSGRIPFHENTSADTYNVVDLFMERQKNAGLAAIPVERMKASLLVISGEQDLIWPSAIYSRELARRLDDAQSKIRRKFLAYSHAGHGIIAPYEAPVYHPLGHFWCALGGTPEGNRQASEDAWSHVLEFIQKCGSDGHH